MNKRNALNNYLDNHILEAVKNYANDEHLSEPKTIKEAASFMWGLFIEERPHASSNLQDDFVHWCMGLSLGTITVWNSEAIDILHANGYYSTPDKEANAVAFLHIKLSMRVRHYLTADDWSAAIND